MASTEPTPAELTAVSNLMMNVGQALGAFSSVEESLTGIFAIAAEMPRLRTAYKITDKVRDFGTKLDMTNAAVKSWLLYAATGEEAKKKAFEAKWITLKNDVRRESELRNKMAHFKVATEDNDNGEPVYYICAYFQPFSHMDDMLKETKLPFRLPKEANKISAEEVLSYAEGFHALGKRIDQFIIEMLSFGGNLPRFADRTAVNP